MKEIAEAMIYKDPSIEYNKALIWGVNPEHFNVSWRCPSVNELRIICKLLDI